MANRGRAGSGVVHHQDGTALTVSAEHIQSAVEYVYTSRWIGSMQIACAQFGPNGA